MSAMAQKQARSIKMPLSAGSVKGSAEVLLDWTQPLGDSVHFFFHSSISPASWIWAMLTKENMQKRQFVSDQHEYWITVTFFPLEVRAP